MKLPAIKILLAAMITGITGLTAYSGHAATYEWDTDATTTNWVADGTTLKWFDSDDDLLPYPLNGSDLAIHAEFYYSGVPKFVNIVGTVDVNILDLGGSSDPAVGPYVFTNGIMNFTGNPTTPPAYKGSSATNDYCYSTITINPDPADNNITFLVRTNDTMFFYNSITAPNTNTEVIIDGNSTPTGTAGSLCVTPSCTMSVGILQVQKGATLIAEGLITIADSTSDYVNLYSSASGVRPGTILLSTNGVLDFQGGESVVANKASGNLNHSLIFDGGTLEWSDVGGTINSSNLNVYVRAGGAVVDVATVGQEAYFINPLLTDPVSLGGGLTKTGDGALSLLGTNTYTGDTVVEAGSLYVNSTNSLSTEGAVRIASGASMALNFTGTNTVGSLYLNGVQQAAGTWGAPDSGAQNTSTQFLTDAGVLLVTQSGPIPPTIQSLIVGNQIQLSWPVGNTGWTLQTQTNGLAADGWVTVPGSTATNEVYIPLDTTDTSVFYRLANL